MPAETATSITVRRPDTSLQKICDEWNLRARKSGEPGFRVSIVEVVRPTGHVNHHLRLDVPSGRRESLSLGSVDPRNVRMAIRVLLVRANAKVPFQF